MESNRIGEPALDEDDSELVGGTNEIDDVLVRFIVRLLVPGENNLEMAPRVVRPHHHLTLDPERVQRRPNELVGGWEGAFGPHRKRALATHHAGGHIGGGGEVYKLEDLALSRIVAGKVLRPSRGLDATAHGLLREARALFRRDRRAVAVAFFLGAAVLLPLVALIVFREGRLWLITNHRQWFDRPTWGTAIVVIGLAVPAVGSFLDTRERQKPRQGSNRSS